MQEKEIAILFEFGALKSCVITNAPLEQGYILILHKKLGGKQDEQIIVEKRARLAKDKDGDNTRVFKTIDAAVSFAYQIGFRKIAVEISDFVTWERKRRGA